MKFLSVVAVVLLCGTIAQAAVITATYVNIQTSDNINFNTAGNVANFGSNHLALGTLPVGKYFRFGIAISVTGNANPVSGSAWETAILGIGGYPAQPVNLGLAQASITVFSSNPTGSDVAPIANTATRTGDPNNVTFTRATIVNPTGGGWALSDRGDVGQTSSGSPLYLGTGIAGGVYPITAGNVSIDALTNAGVANAGQFANPGNTFFNGLMYQVQTTNTVLLNPTLVAGGITLWQMETPGDENDPEAVPATYSARNVVLSFGSELDNLVNVPQLQINIPEPASMGLLALGLLGLVARRRTH